jgi:hypothetical protein
LDSIDVHLYTIFEDGINVVNVVVPDIIDMALSGVKDEDVLTFDVEVEVDYSMELISGEFESSFDDS